MSIWTAQCVFIWSNNVLSCVSESYCVSEQHGFIHVDEASFNLYKTRLRGRNLMGHHIIINGGNMTMCAAI